MEKILNPVNSVEHPVLKLFKKDKRKGVFFPLVQLFKKE